MQRNANVYKYYARLPPFCLQNKIQTQLDPECGPQGPLQWGFRLPFPQDFSLQVPAASMTRQLLALALTDATLSPLLCSCCALGFKFSPFLTAHVQIGLFL